MRIVESGLGSMSELNRVRTPSEWLRTVTIPTERDMAGFELLDREMTPNDRGADVLWKRAINRGKFSGGDPIAPKIVH